MMYTEKKIGLCPEDIKKWGGGCVSTTLDSWAAEWSVELAVEVICTTENLYSLQYADFDYLWLV